VPRRAAAGARGASGARRPRRAGRARKPSGAGGAPPPTGSPPLPPVPPHHEQPEDSARLLSVRLSHGWVRVSIEPGGLSATAPGISRSRNPIREYVEPGVSGLCVLVTLSSWFGSTEDVRDSAQRDPRNLCPPLRMVSLRRQSPGERIEQRPRWVSGIGQGRLSPGWENPICRNRVLGASHSVPSSMHLWVPAHHMEAEWMQCRGTCAWGATIIDTTFMCRTTTKPICTGPEPGVDDQLIHFPAATLLRSCTALLRSSHACWDALPELHSGRAFGHRKGAAWW
jgi:hypothetical protein